MCRGLVTKFNLGSIEEKKHILMEFGRTITIKDEIVSLVSDVEFIRFKEVQKMTILKKEWLELTPDNKDKNIQLYNEIRTVFSGLVYEVRTNLLNFNTSSIFDL